MNTEIKIHDGVFDKKWGDDLAFHLSNPVNIYFRNLFLKYLSKNKNFLENYLGKVYNN